MKVKSRKYLIWKGKIKIKDEMTKHREIQRKTSKN